MPPMDVATADAVTAPGRRGADPLGPSDYAPTDSEALRTSTRRSEEVR